MRDEVAFLKKRRIKSEDIENFINKLGKTRFEIESHPDVWKDGLKNLLRIQMNTQSGKKYIQWRGFSGAGQKEREYTPDPTGFAHDNKVTMILGTIGRNTKFSDEDRLNILRWITHFFGVSEIVIANRQTDGSRVLSTDTKENINMFLGFSNETAKDTWTIAQKDSSLDPDLDRSFKCWKCEKLCDCTDFQSTHSDHRQMFFELLSAYERREVPCCAACVYELTICHVPKPIESSPSAKKRKL